MINKLPSGYSTEDESIESRMYKRGYEKAVRDLQDVVNYVNRDFYYEDVYFTCTKMQSLLHCCRKNWEGLMNSMSGKSNNVFKWNKKKRVFEFVEKKKK